MAAKERRPGFVQANLYVRERVWAWLLDLEPVRRRQVSASAIIATLLDDFMSSSPDEQAPILARAREITLGRWRRAEG